MSYIPTAQREKFKGVFDALFMAGIKSPSELQYLFTGLCVLYKNEFGEKSQTYNDIVGALETVKLEIYRRQIAKYEDFQKGENGEVYL